MKTPITIIIRLNTEDGLEVHPKVSVRDNTELVPAENLDSFKIFAAATRILICQAIDKSMTMTLADCINLMTEFMEKEKAKKEVEEDVKQS